MNINSAYLRDECPKNFILVQTITTSIILALIGLVSVLYFHQNITYTRLLAVVFALILIFVLALLLTTISATTLMWYNKDIPAYINKFLKLSLKLLYPITVLIGRAAGIKIDDIRRTYTQLNNKLVMGKSYGFMGQDILVLTPHCLQKSYCPHKITHEIDNCKRCGECDVDQLLTFKERYGCHFRIVTGGTLARKIVSELRPKAIIAIACERDLISGLLDIGNIPIIAVVNQRPQGPCNNTEVKMIEVEKAIRHFIKE